jgi:hypothetical protein
VRVGSGADPYGGAAAPSSRPLQIGGGGWQWGQAGGIFLTGMQIRYRGGRGCIVIKYSWQGRCAFGRTATDTRRSMRDKSPASVAAVAHGAGSRRGRMRRGRLFCVAGACPCAIVELRILCCVSAVSVCVDSKVNSEVRECHRVCRLCVCVAESHWLSTLILYSSAARVVATRDHSASFENLRLILMTLVCSLWPLRGTLCKRAHEH